MSRPVIIEMEGAAQATDAPFVSGKPCQWSQPYPTQWVDDRYGFTVMYEADEPESDRYSAAWGEGDASTFATLEAAQAWCQQEADAWIAQHAVVAQATGAQADAWRPMDAAPLDGTLVRLLVKFDAHGIEDTDEPAITIGSHNDGEWNFVGWDWHRDEWTRGSGDLLGWLPLVEAQAPAAAVPPADRWAEGYYCAVAALLRNDGCASTNVRELYAAGGAWDKMNPDDAALFAAHGLEPQR